MVQNNIIFNNVNADKIYQRNGKYTHGDNANGNVFDTSLTGDEITKSFNAVEIDWNGAKPGIGEGASGIKTGEIIRGTLRGS